MSRFAFERAAAFPDRAFGGNGCVVMPGGDGLGDAPPQMNTAPAGPPEMADMRARHFPASREIPLAGHPLIACVAAMQPCGPLPGGRVVPETVAGSGFVPTRGGVELPGPAGQGEPGLAMRKGTVSFDGRKRV